MYTRTTPLWQKNKTRKNVLIFIALALLSVYPIYRNYYYGYADIQYERHLDFMNQESQFYNPWQYRILAPLSVEGVKRVYDQTIDQIYPIEEKFKFTQPDGFAPKDKTAEILSKLDEPGFIKYNLIYSAFRFMINFFIYYLAFLFLSHFVKNKWLIFLGIIFMSLSMGNAVNDSDFTLHTYIDNLLYLLAALVIIKGRNGWYIVLLTLIGATNRETCLLIPFLYLVSNIEWESWWKEKLKISKFPWPRTKVILVTAASVVVFAAVFVAIRAYYGYEPQSQWKVPAGLPMLKLNLISFTAVKSYFEMLGAFSLLPFLCIYRFKQASRILRTWFIAIVPLWFLVHFILVVAYQSRLFLVPTFIIFLPMVLEFIEREYLNQLKTQST